MIIRKCLVPSDGILWMPKGAQILSVGFVGGNVALYAMIDLHGKEREERQFKIVVEDREFDPDGLTYVGSCEDWMMFHVFEVSRIVEEVRDAER